MMKRNRKHDSIEKSLMVLDKYENIRIAVIDTLVALGKPREQAQKIGNACKEIAEKNLANNIFDKRKGGLFKMPKHLVETAKKLGYKPKLKK